MPSPHELLERIHAMRMDTPISLMHLCGDHERLLVMGGMRQAMPEQVELVAGPGCAASICPAADVFQAIRLALLEDVTVLVERKTLRLPVQGTPDGIESLYDARAAGADVRIVDAPIEALMAAREQPGRDMVLFCTGFETMFAPLAGLVLEGLPDNLSLLLCGRRVEPMLEQLLSTTRVKVDGILLPGNRCALTGTAEWDVLARRHGLPAVVTGYSATALLTAIHHLLERRLAGRDGVTNLYRMLVRDRGDPTSQDWLYRVFDTVSGGWRGVGDVDLSAFRLREAYAHCDADRRYPDHRGELAAEMSDLRAGCLCADVVLGVRAPADCGGFSQHCRPDRPAGPCMASTNGTCHLRVGVDRAA